MPGIVAMAMWSSASLYNVTTVTVLTPYTHVWYTHQLALDGRFCLSLRLSFCLFKLTSVLLGIIESTELLLLPYTLQTVLCMDES